VVGGGEGAGEGVAGALCAALFVVDGEGLLEAAGEGELVAGVGDEAAAARGVVRRQVVTVDGGEEEDRADAVVEVGSGAAEVLELRAMAFERGGVGGAAEGVEGVAGDGAALGEGEEDGVH